MSDLRVVLTAAAVVLGGSLAGFAGYRTWASHREPATDLVPIAAANVATTQPEAASDTAQNAPARPPVPQEIPAITLPDMAGQPHALRDFLGHPLIINFWATWCAPCRREIPLLQSLRRRYQHEQLGVVGVAIDFKPAVSQYIARTPLSYPVLIGDDQGMMAAEEFGMEAVLPFSVFADARGRIVAVKVGELHRDEADLILEAMRSVAAGRETLAEARQRIGDRLHELAIARVRGNVTGPPPQ